MYSSVKDWGQLQAERTFQPQKSSWALMRGTRQHTKDSVEVNVVIRLKKRRGIVPSHQSEEPGRSPV